MYCHIAILALAVSLGGHAFAQGSKADFARADSLRGKTRGKVLMASLQPHWLAGGERFWFIRETRDAKTFVLVDAKAGALADAFDHDRLAKSLGAASGEPVDPARLPFGEIELAEDRKSIRFVARGFHWTCSLPDYSCAKGERAEPPARSDRRGRQGRARRGAGRGRNRGRSRGPRRSPGGAWEIEVRDHDLYLKTVADGITTRLTDDGTASLAYGSPSWSPDGKHLVVYRTEPGDVDDVYLFESSPRDQLEAKLRSRPYARPGDKLPSHQMMVFSLPDQKAHAVDVEPIGFRGPPRPRWRKDARTFVYEKRDRGHQRARIIEVDVTTRKARTLLDERAKTFLDHYHKHYLRYLGDVDEILWASERDGWNHLYLYDARTGALKNQVTKGDWVVRGVDRVDEQTRQIWFRASGVQAGQDPYFEHHFRIGFDGTGLVALTEGDGTHTLQWSPSRACYVDTYSRVDSPPKFELRRGSDGALIAELGQADAGPLLASGLRLPEVFSAKGRDGETDIWGIIVRPTNFDAERRYPVIEYIYAGPHDSHVPKGFRSYHGVQAMAELGFVVVQIDGMGTNNRSKAFHDVCWKNIGDAGFPDRIRWIRAAAARYPQLDLDRVGIYGTSAGGQNALGALLFHPEFYKVAVSSCGCHDNRLDKASWNEQWMGYPVGPHYKAQSNITNAGKLEGRLLLIVGELDTNVPPESTYRVVDALIKADKDFDFLLVPGLGHSSGGRYGERRRRDFFVRHLHGVEPRHAGR